MSLVFPGLSQLVCAPEDLGCNYRVLLLYLESDSLSTSFILVKEADEGLKYEGEKSQFCSKKQHLQNSCFEGTSFTSYSGLLQGNGFGKRNNLQNKNSKSFSHCRDICHKIQCLETVHFVSLLEGGEEERHNKQSPKWIILRSSYLEGKYIMPMFINRRILKRYLISKF